MDGKYLLGIVLFLFLLVGVSSSTLLLPNTLDIVTSIGNTTNNTIGVGSIVIDESKLLRTAKVDGGDGLIFQSTDILTAGGFPFIWVSQNNNNETIVPFYLQTGRNNSVSAIMNSFGTYPQSYVNFGMGDPIGRDVAGVEFLFNVSDYTIYCAWLQDNLSLVPEGCKQFADTTGRGVPLLFGGDLEVHRTATIHESLLVFNDLDFIGRNGNDVDFFFNGDAGGKHHIRDNRVVEANFSEIDTIICNFDDGTLCGAVSETISPELNRDWTNVLEPECNSERCVNAKGGVDKVISYSTTTLPFETINVSFWLNNTFGIGDSLTIGLDDNQGNTTTVLTLSFPLTSGLKSYVFPSLYEHKDNITSIYTFVGQNVNRELWLDDISATADVIPNILVNESYEGGNTIWGGNSGNCGIEVTKIPNNGTLGTSWQMEIGCPDGFTSFVGDVSQVDVTIQNQTVTGDSTITGNLFVDGEIYLKSVSINSTGLIGLECSNGEILEFNSGVWECGVDSTGSDDQTLAEVLAQGNDANSLRITNLALPINTNDSANKIYVDTQNNSMKTYVDSEISGIDLTPYWKSDGTSTAGGNWDLGNYDLASLNLNANDLSLESFTPGIKFHDLSSGGGEGLFFFDSPNTINDRFRFHFGATSSDYPAFFIQKQDITGTDDMLFLGYNNGATSSFIVEGFKGEGLVFQTRFPLGTGDISFRTGIPSSYSTNLRMWIDATQGDVHLPTDNAKLLKGTGDDAGDWYDGVDWIFDSQLVGTGDFEFRNGAIQGKGGFKSSDGTVGMTGSCNNGTTLTVKNGLITACS